MMTFALALAIATQFWAARHVETPCHATPVRMTDAQMTAWGLDGAAAAAYPWPLACDIYLAPGEEEQRRHQPGDYCADVVHELGNVDGVPETPDAGAVTSVGYTDAGRPWDCTHWRRWRAVHWGLRELGRTA